MSWELQEGEKMLRENHGDLVWDIFNLDFQQGGTWGYLTDIWSPSTSQRSGQDEKQSPKSCPLESCSDAVANYVCGGGWCPHLPVEHHQDTLWSLGVGVSEQEGVRRTPGVELAVGGFGDGWRTWGPLWTGCCHEARIILCLGLLTNLTWKQSRR